MLKLSPLAVVVRGPTSFHDAACRASSYRPRTMLRAAAPAARSILRMNGGLGWSGIRHVKLKMERIQARLEPSRRKLKVGMDVGLGSENMSGRARDRWWLR